MNQFVRLGKVVIKSSKISLEGQVRLGYFSKELTSNFEKSILKKRSGLKEQFSWGKLIPNKAFVEGSTYRVVPNKQLFDIFS
jgi:hypothetical protein